MPKDDHKNEHEHEHECDCNHDEEPEIVTLLDDEGNEHRFAVVDIVEVEGKSYAVLAPEEADEDDDEGEAYIFRIEESENGEDQLVTVDDEEEFERVAQALAELDEGWEEQDDEVSDESEEDD